MMQSMYNKKRGIFFIVAAAFNFSTMNMFARLAGDIPAMQKTFFRNLVAILVISTILLLRRQRITVKKAHLPALLARSLFGTLGVVCNFYAMDRMLLSDATILIDLSPFFVILVSSLLLHEKATQKQYVLIFLALVGACFVIKPTANIFSNDAALAALGCAAFSGIAYAMLRVLSKQGEDGTTIVFFFSAFSCAVCLPSMLLHPLPLTAQQFILLLAAAVFACLGQFSVTAAYRYAPASEISIFDYTQIVFAAVWGWLIFNQAADILSYIGYGIILAAAVSVFLEGRKK